ncbi:DUF3857 domain-containing protein [Fodinibius salinus]|uniref:DUF3857 domain-containing protein n=1 Tax=Fodinibius salinus TaxID=860790 RepID=UPI0011E684CC|nr:DUF3857 domain-containing protein [Fodinibius salinus]
MTRFIVTTLFLFFSLLVSGQAQQFQDAEFGVIPDSLASLQLPADYADASYMITNQERDVRFQEEGNSIVAIMDYHVRLKIFDNSNPEASLITIPYYFENDMEQVSDIRGWTHLPSGKRVPLQSKDIRTVNINARYNVKEFRMPLVQDGSILEYRYTIKRKYIEELPDFYLSHSVPTAAAKTSITYPRYMRYNVIMENNSTPIQNDIVLRDTSSVPKIFTIPQPLPVVTERWMAYNIPPTTKKSYISSLDDYRAKIKFMLSEFGIPRQSLENSWAVAVARMREKTNPLKIITENKKARAVGDSLATTLDFSSNLALQDSIYQYLNRRMSFSGAHHAYSETTDTVVLNGNAADQAAINQTLIAMLRGAGIEAYPVLISTKQSGKINKDFPSFYQFNGQLVQTVVNGQSFLLDASFSHGRPGLIPFDSYNSPGLLFKTDTFEWVDIAPSASRFDIQVAFDGALSKKGTLSGSLEITEKGYPAREVRRQQANGKNDGGILRSTLFERYPDMAIDSAEVITDVRSDSVVLSGQITIENYAQSFSNGLEYPPMLVGYRQENPFESTARTLPVTLDAPERLKVSYSIALPSGFSVKEGKQNQSMGFPGAKFREQYDMQANRLNYGYQINIAQKNFSTALFPRLYDLYERWVELSNSTWLIER